MTRDEELAQLNREAELAQLNREAELARLNSEPESGSSEDPSPKQDGWLDKDGWVGNWLVKPVGDKIAEGIGAIGSMSMNQIRQDAIAKMRKEGRITQEEFLKTRVTGDEQPGVRPGLGEKLSSASDLFLKRAFSSLDVEEGHDKKLRLNKTNPTNYADSIARDEAGESLASIGMAGFLKGQKFLWNDFGTGNLEYLSNVLTIPTQIAARTALSIEASLGMIPREDAIQMMSQTQVYPSDLLDYHWVPETAVGRVARGILGFSTDIALDPTTYASIGMGPAMRAAAKSGTLKLGNRVVTDTMTLSRVERQMLLAQEDLLTLIKRDGSIQKVQGGLDTAEDIIRGATAEGAIIREPGKMLGELGSLSPELGSQAAQIIQGRQKAKGVIRSLADGEASLNFAFRLPFTKTLIEETMPVFGQGTRWAAQGAVTTKDWAVDSALRVGSDLAERSQAAGLVGEKLSYAANVASGAWQSLKTFTTRPLWDSANAKFIHAKVANQAWANREMARASKEVGGDPETSRMMIDWLNQMPTHSDEELLRQFRPYDPKNVKYVAPNGMDYTKLRLDPSDRGTDWALEQYKGSQEYAVRQRGRYLDNPVRSPKGPLSQPNTPLFEANPKYTKLELKEQARDFVTPLRAGSDGKFIPEVADSLGSGGFATGAEFTPIRPTKDLTVANKVHAELLETRRLADETMERLELRNPKAAARVRRIRQQLNARADEMKKRGLPFQVLNPFDGDMPVNERAMGYFPHIMNPDYLDAKGTPKYKAAIDSFNRHQAELGIVDKTAVGRSDRRATNTIIDSIKEASGIDEPIFINDPLSASYQRMQDMDNIIAQHDLLREVFPLAKVVRPGGGAFKKNLETALGQRLEVVYADEIPAKGWIAMRPEDYSSPVMTRSGRAALAEDSAMGKLTGEMTQEAKALEIMQVRSFMPEEYKLLLKEKNTQIFFPEDVATRLKFSLRREKGGVARSALDLYNYWFRNGALFGFGYQGMNGFSNLTTYMNAGADLSHMPRASKFLFEARYQPQKVLSEPMTFGSGRQAHHFASGEEFLDVANRNGIIGNSSASEADIIADYWDNMATTFSEREKFANKAATWTDRLTGFKYNRNAAENADNMFRMGLFMDSLEKGYTIEGARERVMLHFYDFKDMPNGQKIAGNVMPFTSFASKSVESLAQRASRLDLLAFKTPQYVRNQLEGAFVDSYEERQHIQATLPEYSRDRIIGPALAGGHQLFLELPFVINAVNTYFSPEDNIHPLVQSASMALSAMGQDSIPEEAQAAAIDSALYKSKWDEFYGNLAQNLIPPSVRMAGTLLQLGNPDEVRSLPLDFIEKYKQPMFGLDPQTGRYGKTLTNNAHEFGAYAKSISPDWFYNSLMYGQLADPGLPAHETKDMEAMYGSFVKSRMRDMTLGLVRMDRMDKNIILNMTAIQRQIQKEKSALTKVNLEARILRDPLASPELKSQRVGDADKMTQDISAELVELYKRKAAVESFYGFYLSQEKANTGLFDMIREAISPAQAKGIVNIAEEMATGFFNYKKPSHELTAKEAAQQNLLRRSAVDLQSKRNKNLQLQIQGRKQTED